MKPFKLAFLAFAAASAFLVAGCGGNGDNDQLHCAEGDPHCDPGDTDVARTFIPAVIVHASLHGRIIRPNHRRTLQAARARARF